ncbi:MAG: 7,8-didemethyl-8-hydroxy-5-deazariboflavin synthase [Rhodospirillaceae bacterium]|nr:7,8-didemethyl-8-hydroxy-5-deazariboflavin synthase [Rhodospirillaceae bacterium]
MMNFQDLLTKNLDELMASATAKRDEQYGNIISFSRKVFIPLTTLCRDVCHYCTFAKSPQKGCRAYLDSDEVLAIAQAGRDSGCKEALFTLGDKPEARYRIAREELALLGHETTLSYLSEMAALVFEKTGLLPHLNPGVMSQKEVSELRDVSVSQGIMLESTSKRLCEKGGPHYGSPDKDPLARLMTIEVAGALSVPFTSGLLIGIGETRAERIETLVALRDAHIKHSHIQEVIIQNFRAKPNTKMAQVQNPKLEELLWTIAVARLILPSSINIQVPPNLNDGVLPQLIAAGINDWGGVSPVTPDHVNPEAPWPHLDKLANETARDGKQLTERLAIYPKYAQNIDAWAAPAIASAVKQQSDSEGYARCEDWTPGSDIPVPIFKETGPCDHTLLQILDKAQAGHRLCEPEIAHLFSARGGNFEKVCEIADEIRREAVGNDITYVVNRNINYTNVCSYRCQFCAFSKGKLSENLRGRPYVLDLDEVARRASEAWERGATEICMQGGIHPQYTGETYVELVKTVRTAAPDLHIHAFTPLEIRQGARTLGLSIRNFLIKLQAAGLGTLPGTAAEILDDEVRAVICPDKLSSSEWLDVMKMAHELGLKTTATIMFGHVDQPLHWARHLKKIRDLQELTNGFTELVPLPFVPMEAPIYLKGRARFGPTYRESILMHAVSRIVLHPVISNIQASWVKMGIDGLKDCLESGANDAGGTLMNETITRAAGAQHGQEMPISQMIEIIKGLGRSARQRTTLYETADAKRVTAAKYAKPLTAVINAPAANYSRRNSTALTAAE